MVLETESPAGSLAGGSSPPVVEFAIRRPRFWSPRFTIVFLLLVIGAGGYYAAVWPPLLARGLAGDLVLELLLPAAVCGMAVLMRLGLRPARVPPVSFHADHLSAPRHPEARRAVRVDYDDILAVDLRGLGGKEQLLIGTKHRLLTLPRPAFLSPDAVEHVLKELYLRILRLPQGGRIVEQIAKRRKLALAAMSRSATATHVILGLALLVFALEFLTGALDEPFGLVRFGAAAPVLVRAGEVYRLLASVLLHANVVHMYFDGLAFFFLGSILERLLGRSRFLLVYLVAGLAGALASTGLGTRLFSANASAATFGLLGAYMVVSRRFGTDLPVGFRQPLRWWAVMTALNAALPLFVPEIDPIGMVAGLVAGVVTAFLVIDERDGLDPARPTRLALRFTAGVLATVYGSAFVSALAHGMRAGDDSELRFARAVADDPASSAGALDVLAWRIARHAQAGPDELEVARRASDQARAQHPTDPGSLDAWAAIQYRLGHLDEAVAAGREVVRLQPGGYYAEHLARYLRHRLQARGPIMRGSVQPGAVKLSVTPASPGRAAEAQLHVSEDLPAPTTVLAVALSGSETVGLVRVRVPAGAAGTRVLAARQGALFPAGASYAVALVDSECPACDAEPAVTFWNLEAQVHDLP